MFSDHPVLYYQETVIFQTKKESSKSKKDEMSCFDKRKTIRRKKHSCLHCTEPWLKATIEKTFESINEFACYKKTETLKP